MKNFYLLHLFFITQISVAQIEDGWVFFKDKENVEISINNPLLILTQKAIDRKNAHATPIDERDVPVNESYISVLKNTEDIRVLAKSKWFNCVYVRGTESAIRNLGTLNFVKVLDFADNSLNTNIKRKSCKYIDTSIKNKIEVVSNANFDYGQAAAQIQQIEADYLHQQGFTGQGITIAVMDSGFPNVNTNDAFKQAREEGRLLDGYDFVNREENEFSFTSDTHGSLTFSNIAGFVDGQFVGTAPDANYHLFITEDVSEEGPKEEALWVEAAERADSLGVDVINTSLGYSDGFTNPAYNYTTDDMDGQTTFISRGANIAFDKGMLVVAAAGNSGRTEWSVISAPGDASGVLTVGAVDEKGAYAAFSSIGPTADNRIKPDVVSRGQDAMIITINGSIGMANGTSFSSPIMAGAVACLWQAYPEKTNADIMQLVRESGNQYANPDAQLGYGIPNFKSLLQVLGTSNDVATTFNIFPNPVRDELFIAASETENFSARIFSFDGKLILDNQIIRNNQLPVSKLSSGMYIIELTSKNAVFKTKFLKK